jgi:trans-aconitate methyltransferase
VELAGVDISERAVQLARQRLPRATFSVLDLTREHLNRTFDLIVCSDVVEHIEDHRSALRNMRAMTGRWCLVATLQGRMRSFEPEMGHVRNYRRGELASLMREAGFRIVRQAEWGFPLYSPLYRDLLERVPPGATTGQFGPGRIVLSRLLYYAFFLNTYRFGDYVFCLGAAD